MNGAVPMKRERSSMAITIFVLIIIAVFMWSRTRNQHADIIKQISASSICEEVSDSQLFSEAGYDYDNRVLVLISADGTEKYYYWEVPDMQWTELKKADSFDDYFTENIRGYYQIDTLINDQEIHT